MVALPKLFGLTYLTIFEFRVNNPILVLFNFRGTELVGFLQPTLLVTALAIVALERPQWQGIKFDGFACQIRSGKGGHPLNTQRTVRY